MFTPNSKTERKYAINYCHPYYADRMRDFYNFIVLVLIRCIIYDSCKVLPYDFRRKCTLLKNKNTLLHLALPSLEMTSESWGIYFYRKLSACLWKFVWIKALKFFLHVQNIFTGNSAVFKRLCPHLSSQTVAMRKEFLSGKTADRKLSFIEIGLPWKVHPKSHNRKNM